MTRQKTKNDRRLELSRKGVTYDHNKRQAPGHEQLFDDIEKLANTNIETYSCAVEADAKTPWRRQTLNRAKAISVRARRSLDEHRNESGWRLHLESWIFSRFEVEVICQNCRARLWRSELEAAASNATLSLKSLEQRRLARKPCDCRDHRKSEEKHDDGLNSLFEDRSEDQITYEEDVERKGRKKKKIPDRIWGLRMTKRIERILNGQRPGAGNTVRETIKTSPCTGDASRLLYPFLILEAKSEKSADSFSDISLQTGLTIPTLLNLQHEFSLQVQNGLQGSLYDSPAPLVWMLSSKGDQWRLLAAYTHNDGSGIKYHILDLWNGRLIFEQDALRLLLMLDYIFDWARDVYRRSIVDGLLSLVQSPSSSLRSETDVYSTKGCLPDHADINNFVPQEKTFTTQSDEVTMLRLYDVPGLALRNADTMYHKVCGLQVTIENLSDFLRSVSKTQDDIVRVAAQLLNSFRPSEYWIVTAECLNSLEKLWTEYDRDSESFMNPQQQFLATFRVSSYFGTGSFSLGSTTRSDNWVQIHALDFVAIDLDTLHELEQMLKMPVSDRFESVPHFPTDDIIKIFGHIRNAPIQQCLAAAVECRQVSSSSVIISSAVQNLFRQPRMIATQQDAICRSKQFSQLVYRQLKTSIREPNEKFLRTSAFTGKQTATNPKCEFWPGGELELEDREIAVLVTRSEKKNLLGVVDAQANCLFLLPPSSQESIQSDPLYGQYRLSIGNLRLAASAGCCHNIPCTESICIKTFLKALEIIHHTSKCYFQFVCLSNPLEPSEFFLRWGSKDPVVLDLPEGDREQWLSCLRDTGLKLNFGQTLETLNNAYNRMLSECDLPVEALDHLNLAMHKSVVKCACTKDFYAICKDESDDEDKKENEDDNEDDGDCSEAASDSNMEFYVHDLNDSINEQPGVSVFVQGVAGEGSIPDDQDHTMIFQLPTMLPINGLSEPLSQQRTFSRRAFGVNISINRKRQAQPGVETTSSSPPRKCARIGD